MSLRSIPVDADRIRFVAIDVEAVQDYNQDGTRSDRQRADQDGIPLWRVNTLCMVDGVAGGETTPIRIAADHAPVLAPLSEVRFVNLHAKPWSQGDRSGVALVADGLEDPGKGSRRTTSTAAATEGVDGS